MLWMKNQLEHLQIFESNVPIFCDNTASICLSKNPILHSRAKHIEIKHHFIRDYVQKGVISLKFIDTDHQWDDIFTKPLLKIDSHLFWNTWKLKIAQNKSNVLLWNRKIRLWNNIWYLDLTLIFLPVWSHLNQKSSGSIPWYS